MASRALRPGALSGDGPEVSVVVATYNACETLAAALASIQAQEFEDFEVLVIGDACTDGSARVVASLRDPRFRWHNRAENSGGQGAPNNEGLRRSGGRYVAYLGHDDLWFPWHLEGLVDRIERDRLDLVHSMCALLAPASDTAAIGPLGPGHTYSTQVVPPSTWLHRRELVESCGLWPEDPFTLRTGVDAKWLARVHGAGHSIACHPRLSVLKFPSRAWGAYAAGAPKPQPQFLARMRADPVECERYVLTQIAVAAARHWASSPTAARALSDAFAQIARRSVHIYGPDRWPLRSLLRARFQARYRGKDRRARGLPTAY